LHLATGVASRTLVLANDTTKALVQLVVTPTGACASAAGGT
jgi:hypothetical protein